MASAASSRTLSKRNAASTAPEPPKRFKKLSPFKPRAPDTVAESQHTAEDADFTCEGFLASRTASQPPLQLTEEKPFALAPVTQALERFKKQKEQMDSALEQIESVGNFAIRSVQTLSTTMAHMVETSNANFAETRAQIGQLSGSVQALMLNSFDSVDPMVHALMSLIMHLRGGERAASLPEGDRIIDPNDLEIFDRLTILTMHEGRPMLTIPKECAPVFWAGFAHVFNLHLRMTNIAPFCVRYGVSVDYDHACIEEEKIVVKRGVKRLQKIGRQSAQYRDFHLVISETTGLFRGFMFNTSLAYVMNHRPYGYEGQRFVEWEDGTVNAKGSRVKKIQLLPQRKNYEDADALIALRLSKTR